MQRSSPTGQKARAYDASEPGGHTLFCREACFFIVGCLRTEHTGRLTNEAQARTTVRHAHEESGGLADCGSAWCV